MDGSDLSTEQLKDMALSVRALQHGGSAGAARLHRDLCNCAALYVLSRERFLLPTWQRQGGGDADRLQAYAGFKRALAELVLNPPGRPGHAAALAAFEAAVQAQREEDRHVLVPSLREDLDVAERRSVFNEIEVFYLAGHAPPAPRPAVGAPPARALLEEAEVVLSSLGRRGAPRGG